MQQPEIDQIARTMKVQAYQIKNALKFYKIEKRSRVHRYSRYSGIFTNLNLGESRELECLNNRRPTYLYAIVANARIQISMRKIAVETYQITRLK